MANNAKLLSFVVVTNYSDFQQDYSDEIVDELYTDPTEPIEDDNFLYDEEEDSDAEETYGDSFSIGSNQRPKLR